jgi:hypothetical protein
VLLDIRVTAHTTPAGRPVRINARDGSYQVLRILGEWRTPGEARLYRLQVTTPHGTAIADVVGPAADHQDQPDGPWRLRQIWH